MANSPSSLRYAIGKGVHADIFSAAGVLLVAASTILTSDHVDTLERHGIALAEEDVFDVDTYTDAGRAAYRKMVDGAVVEVGRLFDQVRETKKVPIADLRSDIVPIIQEAAGGSDLYGLFISLQAKDDYTYRHNLAVGALSSLLGGWLGLDHQERLQLTTAALLHDVGKMLIPQEVLNKPGKLTEEEYAVMQSHTVNGYAMLRDTVGVGHRQALVALQHHERMDGSGYPLGLTHRKIDLFSRIVAVADVFHAMTSKRVYRDASPFYEVLYQMERDTFGVLDPSMTKLFIRKLMTTLIGRSVQLTDGSAGTILLIHPHDPTHPLIQVGDGFKDLSKDRTLRIGRVL